MRFEDEKDVGSVSSCDSAFWPEFEYSVRRCANGLGAGAGRQRHNELGEFPGCLSGLRKSTLAWQKRLPGLKPALIRGELRSPFGFAQDRL
ncbi:MAG: hypothetical protein WCC04_02110 [Terriglobales bacterium]